MNRNFSGNAILSVALSLGVATCSGVLVTPSLYAQNNQSGDISGTVADPTGALVGGAKIVVINTEKGTTKEVTSSSSGSFRFSLLEPGLYTITISHDGFETVKKNVNVVPGQIAQADVRLPLGASSTSVDVSETEPLLNTETADLSTTFSQQQVQDLPNPGNDLTFVAQTAPGVVMNTQGGYGNFSAFGLPATSNTFTVDGGYENDPFLNLNNSGASNLLLGNNDISEVTVTSNAYTAQFGGLGGSQINEISRSGSNRFHGDATYFWNGSALNANDFFNNQSGTARPRSNANQWSGAIGGPIRKDSTFFFFETEGLRVIIPVRGTVYAPSAAYINSTLANVGAAEGANAAQFYQLFFNEYTKNAAYATAAATSDPDAVSFNAQSANFAHEVLYTGRIDQNIGKKDLLFGHVKIDKGVQPTFTSLLDPLFNAASPQPQYEGQLSETHNFSPNLINQGVFAAIYYRALFTNTNSAAANAITPFSIIFASGALAGNGLAETPGGEDFAWTQGRNVTGYQFVDDLSYVHGKHTFKTGFALRRDDVTDYGPGVYNTPLLEAEETTVPATAKAAAIPGFDSGQGIFYQQNFPTHYDQPVSLYTLGMYVQDEWKLAPNFTLSYGIRFEHNSDPVCHNSCFSLLGSDFSNLSTDTTTAYSTLIKSGLNKAFEDFQKVGYEPRVGFSWAPLGEGSHTQVRGGFGIFSDSFPGQIADSLLNNAPNVVPIQLGGGPIYAGASNSYASQASASNQAFQSGFHSGGSLSTLSTTDSAFAAPNFTNATRRISYPTYEEYSLQIQQQLTRTAAVNVSYTGNHGYHEPVSNDSINAYNASGSGFASLPTSAPNPNFAGVNEVYSGASSNYNGIVFSFINRAKILTTQVNYSYSHALDEISNGGFDNFSGSPIFPDNPSSLRQNYGNADYDTRNYFSGNFVFNMPYYGGPRIVTSGWEITGDAFHSSGLPFSFTDSATANASLANYDWADSYSGIGEALFAQQTVPHLPNKCSGNRSENGGAGDPVQCAAALDVTSATDFGQQHRNQVFGPSYTDTDVTISKAFNAPHGRFETLNLRIGVQAFNVLNHPNFGQPVHDLSVCGTTGCAGSTLGTITSTVNPPTSILGSFLGGDASPRLLQLKAKLSF